MATLPSFFILHRDILVKRLKRCSGLWIFGFLLGSLVFSCQKKAAVSGAISGVVCQPDSVVLLSQLGERTNALPSVEISNARAEGHQLVMETVGTPVTGLRKYTLSWDGMAMKSLPPKIQLNLVLEATEHRSTGSDTLRFNGYTADLMKLGKRVMVQINGGAYFLLEF